MIEDDEITQYLKPENRPLLDDLANWHADVVPEICPVCGQKIENEKPFYLYTEIGGIQFCMAGHYACAFQEQYVQDFQESQADGFLTWKDED